MSSDTVKKIITVLGKAWVFKTFGGIEALAGVVRGYEEGKVVRVLAAEVGLKPYPIRKALAAAGLVKAYTSSSRARSCNSYTGCGSTTTPCLCPNSRCRRKHKMSLNWTGPLPAKKLCPRCLSLSS